MKVLFAVSSESISDAIIKKYQSEYKEILSYKNVYYFNAILKEIQKDKSYDRIVISEDLEPLPNNNYDQIDKFLFEKLDNISDEAQDIDGNETSIILICSDRHTKGSSFLVKLFGIGVYNALLGEDRRMENVCKLIKKPRLKKEAKMYYKIDAEDVNYSNKSEKEVSEVEITNILNHFKKLGRSTEKYSASFDNIASQYTDEQLRIIINCLPMNVKAILEGESPKYQELMSVNGIKAKSAKETMRDRDDKERTGISIDILENRKSQISGPIVIPSTIKNSKNKAGSAVKRTESSIDIPSDRSEERRVRKIVKREEPTKVETSTRQVKSNASRLEAKRESIEEPVRTKKVRPQSLDEVVSSVVPSRPKSEEKRVKKPISDGMKKARDEVSEENSEEKKGRGRPKKDPAPLPFRDTSKKNKIVEDDVDFSEDEEENDLFLPDIEEIGDSVSSFSEVEDDDVDLLPDVEEDEYEEDDTLPEVEEDEYEDDTLPEVDEDEYEDDTLPDVEEDEYEDDLLPGMEDEDDTLPEVEEDEYEDDLLPETEDEYTEEVDLPGLDELDEGEDEDEDDNMLPDSDEDEDTEEDDDELLSSFEDEYEDDGISSFNETPQNNKIESIKPKVDYSMSSLNSLMTKDKKIVTFLGTTKNGTSFLVNNLAALFSSCGISTAILDMTKNKNSYYVYTNNEENLRNIAYNSISKLQKGFAEGIKVDKNLSVYTALPNDGNDYSDAESILSTLVQNHSLVLIDCDFDTNPAYFASCQEIYLVQSMDILTIQPLTAFLRDLKAEGVLESEKIRVVVNKEIGVKSLTSKSIIAGMSFYNDPSMSFMTELFDRDMVKACSIPFEDDVYSIYLDSMVNCSISLRKYSKTFINKLKNLGDMVYPLVSKSTYSNSGRPEPQAKVKKNHFSGNMNNTLNQMRKKY